MIELIIFGAIVFFIPNNNLKVGDCFKVPGQQLMYKTTYIGKTVVEGEHVHGVYGVAVFPKRDDRIKLDCNTYRYL